MSDKKKLTPKQERFVKEYLVDLNATQAAIRAGYSKKTAKDIACENLAKPYLAEAIAKGRLKLSEKVEVSQDMVVREYKRLAFFDIRKLYNSDGTLKRVIDLDDDTAAALIGMDVIELADGTINVKKLKMANKNSSLDSLGKHLGMFKEKVEHDLTDGLADRLARALEKSSERRNS